MAFSKFQTPKGDKYCIQIIPLASDDFHKVKLLNGATESIASILCDETQVEKVVNDYHKKAIDYFRLHVKFKEILSKNGIV